jgi:hypothetical protein
MPTLYPPEWAWVLSLQAKKFRLILEAFYKPTFAASIISCLEALQLPPRRIEG